MGKLISVLLMDGSRVSKTKLTAIIGAIINILYQFELLPTDQIELINTAIMALLALFMRDAISNESEDPAPSE